jgi:hypothetical protein
MTQNENKLNSALQANEEQIVSPIDGNEQEEQNVSSLFVSESQAVANGNHQLNKTARLTQIAQSITDKIWKVVSTSGTTYEADVRASQKSHDAMDDLINQLENLADVDVRFLQTVSEEELEKMIRSQQSKRSRSKSKAMTVENYLTMMTGAVAENLLRLAAGKPKSAGGGAVMGEIGFSAEDLDALAEFPEELKKAIRNVQSKKSIMKSKANFDIQDVRWQQLLRAEQQLKEVRDRVNGIATKEAEEALNVKKQAEEMLADVNTDDLDADEAKRLLDMMKEMLANR